MSWDQNLQKVSTFETVEEFWATFNHVKPPSAIDSNSTYYLFEYNVKPAWEDPANKNGGKWQYSPKPDAE